MKKALECRFTYAPFIAKVCQRKVLLNISINESCNLCRSEASAVINRSHIT